MGDTRDKHYIRSPRDISKIIKHAKLSVDELTSTTQTLFFANDFTKDNSDLKLLELDDYLLTQIKQNRFFSIKGKESVVLCTSDRTYDLKEAEVSNSLLIIPKLEFFTPDEDGTELLDEEMRDIKRNEVTGIFYSYIEPKICTPRFKKLYEILEATKFRGVELEDSSCKTFTFEEILAQVEASKKELKECLSHQKVVVLNNKIRKLDFQYHFRVLSYILDLIQGNSWNLDEIDKSVTIDSYKDIIPEVILEQVFDWNTEKLDNGKYRYIESKVCRHLAEALLKTSGNLVLEDFLQAWNDSAPEGMNPREEMLYGLAVIDRGTSPGSIRLLCEEALPENIVERFKVLFQMKERWSKEQILPYITPLATQKLDVNLMLTKYARGATVDGCRYYLAKHCK